MNALAIIAQVCSIAGDAVGQTYCRLEPIEIPILEENVSIYGCAGPQGQMQIGQWEREHPGWRVRKWKCGPSVRSQTARI